MYDSALETAISEKVENILPEISLVQTQYEILQGLRADQKYIPSKFFYDDRGSKLFEAITALADYYPTRTEKQIIRDTAPLWTQQYSFHRIVELGSGDCSKISLVLESLTERQRRDLEYVPVDISSSAIEQSLQELAGIYPELETRGMVADIFTQMDRLPRTSGKTLFCFFGSTLGNFDPEFRLDFLQHQARVMMPGDLFLLGVDRVKELEVLEKAYNDREGLTAAFNCNILSVVNKLIGAKFHGDLFCHRAFYNHTKERIEMHLVAQEEMLVPHALSSSPLLIREGETIHTENSYKFNPAAIKGIGEQVGFRLLENYTDKKRWFSELLFEKR